MTTGLYAAEHASAYTDVLAAGVAVTFTRRGTGTYDATTDTWSGGGADTTVLGAALQVKPDVLQYQALSLVVGEAPTLTFVPATYGQLPALNDKVTWAGDVYTVKSVQPIDPDGVAIMAKVVVSR